MTSVRPAKRQVLIQGSEVILYNADANISAQSYLLPQSYLLRLSTPTTVVFPGELLEMDVPPDFDPDCTLAIEARTDAPSNKRCKVTQLWPRPHIVEAVAHKVRIVNNTSEPRTIRRHKHLCQVRHTTTLDSASAPVESPLSPSNNGDTSPRPNLFSDAVTVDPDHIIPESVRHQFRQVLQTYDDVFNPTVVGYNGVAGPIEATVNMGPVQPPQRKGCVPQYSRDKLVELQEKFDELERSRLPPSRGRRSHCRIPKSIPPCQKTIRRISSCYGLCRCRSI